MLSSIYRKIYEIILKEVNIEPDSLIKILEYIQDKRQNSFIYPSNMIDNFQIEERVMTRVLLLLVRESILKQAYKIFCPKCQNLNTNIFEDFVEVEEYEFCEKCEEVVFDSENPMKYLVILFKVIGNE
jgi:hypothetical protein